MLVKNWMTTDLITIGPDDSMQEAIRLLQEHQIQLLPVVENGQLVGIVSDRDLKRASPSDATTLDMHELLYLISKLKIRDLMKKEVITVPLDYTVEETAQLLLEHRLSGVPVVDGSGQLAGIITRIDIFRVLIDITGLGKRGVQFALQLKDELGAIREIRELIRQSGARTASILTATDKSTPEGYFKAYFRIYEISREALSKLEAQIQEKAKMIYIVDHRHNTRVLFE